MKEIYYTYNNEAIAGCIFLSVLDKVKTMDIARSCLILPFLLDDKTVVYFDTNRDIEFTLEQIIKEQPKLFISFNKRYLSLLPVTINSLMILVKTNQISNQKEIVLNENVNFSFSDDCGNRLTKINSVMPKFLSTISQYSTNELYKLLNVQL